jgi:hypothetical protein
MQLKVSNSVVLDDNRKQDWKVCSVKNHEIQVPISVKTQEHRITKILIFNN